MNLNRTFTLLIFCALVGGTLSCSRGRGDANRGSIIFSHAQHLEEADCGDCHEDVEADSGQPAGKLIPKKAVCAGCHEDEVKDKARCAMCHRGARSGVALKRVDRLLSFSHKGHAGRVKQCQTCHPKEKQGGASIPGHATCNSAECHKKRYASLGCGQCHRKLSQYPRNPVAELSHGRDFARNHGTQARQNVAACTQCHDQSYCAECHAKTAMDRASIRFPERVAAGFIHRGDFLTRHAVEARAEPQSCRKCHGQRTCRGCHALNGLATSPHEKLAGGRSRRVHPAGWMTPGATSFHGHQARLDIGRCASCHDQGNKSNCVGCHRVGGMGGSPHPPEWGWRDKSGQCRSNAMCQTCHTGGSGCK